MLILLSPAMNMVIDEQKKYETTVPTFIEKAEYIANILKEYSPWELESLLGVNPQIAQRAYEYYQDFNISSESLIRNPAILSFQGLAYKNLNPKDFTKKDFLYAEESVRILSGLYGILKPFDSILPYRLDFMCNFAKQKINEKKLYEFWGDLVYKEVFKKCDTAINLCSGEYEKLIVPLLNPFDNLVTCQFLVNKAGRISCQATASKIARGKMARFIIKNRLKNPHEIKSFDDEGYVFAPSRSNDKLFVFITEIG